MLDKLVPDIQKTAELVSEINAASSEQNKGIQQVNTAVQQFNQVIQANASASEELASTAEELSSQAEELKSRISFFKVDRAGNHSTANSTRQRHTASPAHSVHSQFKKMAAPTRHDLAADHYRDDSTGSPEGVTLNMSDNEDNDFERI